MIAYNVQEDMDRPLFGVSTRREGYCHHWYGEVSAVDPSYHQYVVFRVHKLVDTKASEHERLLNLVVGVVTTMCVAVTLISAFVFPTNHITNPLHIYFAFCISFVCISLLILIHWYRQGDVDPKFRRMIYYNSLCIVLLCVCANLYFHNVGVTCKPNSRNSTYVS